MDLIAKFIIMRTIRKFWHTIAKSRKNQIQNFRKLTIVEHVIYFTSF